MSNIVLILILIAGVVLIFTIGYLISHAAKLDDEFNDMMNNGGNVTET